MRSEEIDRIWMSAHDALLHVSSQMTLGAASRAICARAHAGMVRARAKRFMKFSVGKDDFDVPKHFWWAKGEAALEQNWITGDFKTWIDKKMLLHAYGVRFDRSDILAMVEIKSDLSQFPEPTLVQPDGVESETASQPKKTSGKSGRPPDERWEDVLIEIFGQLLDGKLIPGRQADILHAILDFAATIDFLPSESSAKSRARKIFKRWQQIGQEVPKT